MEDFGHNSAAPIFSNQKTLRAQQQAEPPQTKLELDIAAYICARHNHANKYTTQLRPRRDSAQGPVLTPGNPQDGSTNQKEFEAYHNLSESDCRRLLPL